MGLDLTSPRVAISDYLGNPYQPMVEALDQMPLTAEPGSPEHLLPEEAGNLLRSPPNLRRHLPDLPRPSTGDQEYWVALFDAYRRLFAATARERPMAMILADLLAHSWPALWLGAKLGAILGGSRWTAVDADGAEGAPHKAECTPVGFCGHRLDIYGSGGWGFEFSRARQRLP